MQAVHGDIFQQGEPVMEVSVLVVRLSLKPIVVGHDCVAHMKVEQGMYAALRTPFLIQRVRPTGVGEIRSACPHHRRRHKAEELIHNTFVL